MAHSDDIPKYVVGDELYNSELYRALTQGNTERVVKLCKQIPEGPLHVVSIHKDTVLHMASYSMQYELVSKLLEIVPPDQLQNLTHQNEVGNTILHEAAAFDKLKPAAMSMLDKEPKLLHMCNKFEVTALYRAVQFGKQKMLDFLDRQVKNKYENSDESYDFIYQSKDKGSNILHAAVSAEQFDLAYVIARKNEDLIVQRDQDGRTALDILSSNSSAFQNRRRKFLRRYVYPYIASRATPDPEEVVLGWRVPWWEEIKKEVRKYELALRLAKHLVQKDTSWKETNPVEEAKGNENPSSTSNQNNETQLVYATKSEFMDIVKKILGNYLKPIEEKVEYWKGNSPISTPQQIHETPLFIATKSGCIEIVKLILAKYPQAVEHVDNNGHTILHIAIKYRQMEVFNMVEKMKFPMRRLIQKLDKNSNSILHMVGEKGVKNVLEGKIRSPALVLHDNLLLFERVKKICSENYFKQVNSSGQTAEELFALNNEKLREDAKEWLKGIAQNCSIVAVLIATVAFAAAYTVPGGPKPETGAPILLNQPFFLIFTIADVLSLSGSLTSIIIFLKILTFPFQLNEFKQSLPQQLMLGVSFLFFSVSMMTMAFAATIMLMIQSKQQGTKITLYIVSFLPLPVSIFAIFDMPLYFSLMETVKLSLRKIGAYIPRYVCNSRTDFSREADIQSSSSNHPLESQEARPPV